MSQLASFKTAQGEEIELTVSEFKIYTVECWDANGESRWNRGFHDKDKAVAEFERWRYLEVQQ